MDKIVKVIAGENADVTETLATLYGAFDVVRHGSRDEVKERFSFTMSPTGLKVRLGVRALDPEREPGASGDERIEEHHVHAKTK